MSEFALARALSDGARQANEYHCFCYDCDDGDNDINDVSKFVRLGCRCVLHYHCLVQYVRNKLGDRLTMSLNGISCPYGSDCQSFKTLDEVGGDDTKIYYITTADLDTIVDYGMNHAKLQQYLHEHGCEALTHEEVSGLREWIEQQVNTPHRKFTDEDYDLFIISTTKACPSCGYRSTHYQGHQCHHISPARPPQRGGCPNCHVNYCYKCLSTEVENRRDRGSNANCRCGYWSNYCHLIQSSSDIKSYIAINEGGVPYDTRCGCVICSDCRYGKRCEFCSGDCCVCTGHVNPSPSECIDTSCEEKKWKAEGPVLNTGSSSRSDDDCDSKSWDASWDAPRPRIRSGYTLWDCCRHGDAYALRQLLESGAVTTRDLSRQDGDGRTALYLACDARHTECVRLLLLHDGTDVNIANSSGRTPLYDACDEGHTDIVRLLLSHDGIDVNKAYIERKESPLYSRWGRGDTNTSRLLSHANMADSERGKTPLYAACQRGHTDIVRLLLSHNDTNVNGVDEDGISYLHYACLHGHTEIVELLLEHDAIEVFIKTNDGDTPLNFAVKKGHNEIVDMLVRHPQFDPYTMFIS